MIQDGRIPREHPLFLLEGPLLPRQSFSPPPSQTHCQKPLPSPPSTGSSKTLSHPALGMSFHSLTFVLPSAATLSVMEAMATGGGGQGDRVA